MEALSARRRIDIVLVWAVPLTPMCFQGREYFAQRRTETYEEKFRQLPFTIQQRKSRGGHALLCRHEAVEERLLVEIDAVDKEEVAHS